MHVAEKTLTAIEPPAVLQVHPEDNVAVALRSVALGQQLDVAGIDFDAGNVLVKGLQAEADELMLRIQEIASGETTAAERNGEREIAIWKRGVTL